MFFGRLMEQDRSKGEYVTQSEENKQQNRTVQWHRLCLLQQDIQFITSGYRAASNSYTKSAASIRSIHNQSVNTAQLALLSLL